MNHLYLKRLISLLLGLLFMFGSTITAFAAEKETVKLKAPDAFGNVPFSVGNMFPGDSEQKEFTVKVSHKKPAVLYYHADIQNGSEKLAEVLMVKIELPEKDKTLYEGLMKDMPDALEHSLKADEKEVLYCITAWLDTSVGNEYQNQTLMADFRWWYVTEESGKTDSEEVKPEDTNDDGSVTVQGKPSKTGDSSPIFTYIALAAGAIIIYTVILLGKRKKEADRDE